MPPSESPASIPLVHYALRVETRSSSSAEAAVFEEDSWKVRRIEYDDDLTRLLDHLQDNETLKGLLLWEAEQKDVGIKASRSPSGPPKQRRRDRRKRP